MQLNRIPTDTLWETVEGITLKQEALNVLGTTANPPMMQFTMTTAYVLSTRCDPVCRDGMPPNQPRVMYVWYASVSIRHP